MSPDFLNTLPSCIFHSTLPTSFACISSETFEVRFIERSKMRSSCLGWKGLDESKPNLKCRQISLTHCLAASSIAHCQLLLHAFRVKRLKLDSLSAVKCACRVWGGKVKKPFSLSARVRMSSLFQCLPFITTGVAHQIISQYIGTGTVATSQPADVRLPFVSCNSSLSFRERRSM